MKNINLAFAVLFSAAIFTLVSCKKDQNGLTDPNVVNISAADSTKTITVQKGKVIAITLNNPGDGGYQFNNWQYDTSILRLTSHIHTGAADTKLIGNFGTDTWQFAALATGTSDLTLTASRGQTNFIDIFKGIIKVQ